MKENAKGVWEQTGKTERNFRINGKIRLKENKEEQCNMIKAKKKKTRKKGDGKKTYLSQINKKYIYF